MLEQRPPDALASRALQNLGTSLAAEGDREGAAKAMVEALQRDPGNEDARYDLEVLLRKQARSQAPQQQGQQGGQEPKQQPPQDRQQGRGQPPPGQDRGKERQGAQDPRQQQPRPQGPEQPQEARPQQGQPQQAPQAPMSRQDAERLLDALRSREKASPAGGTRAAGRPEGGCRQGLVSWRRRCWRRPSGRCRAWRARSRCRSRRTPTGPSWPSTRPSGWRWC
ncbi:MAG: hypothetical protein QM767_25300 [Anaeromyxobacter sp.]